MVKTVNDSPGRDQGGYPPYHPAAHPGYTVGTSHHAQPCTGGVQCPTCHQQCSTWCSVERDMEHHREEEPVRDIIPEEQKKEAPRPEGGPFDS